MGSSYNPGTSWTAGLSTSTAFATTAKTGVEFRVLIDQIEQLTQQAKSKIGNIRARGSAMSIGDMFDLQMAMNKLQQFSELSTAVIATMNSSINSMSRNIKG